MDLEIVKTDTPRRDLLLLADESEESVADYAGRGTTYVARRDGEILGQYVFLHTRPFTAEVVNIAVVPEHQRKGIATAMLRHAVATARAAGFHLLEIGTGDLGAGQIALYERCGFVRCGVDVDYFRKHYPVPFSQTASNAATWCACAWNSNNRLCRSVGTRGTDAASSAKAAGTATSTGRMRSTTRTAARYAGQRLSTCLCAARATDVTKSRRARWSIPASHLISSSRRPTPGAPKRGR